MTFSQGDFVVLSIQGAASPHLLPAELAPPCCAFNVAVRLRLYPPESLFEGRGVEQVGVVGWCGVVWRL